MMALTRCSAGVVLPLAALLLSCATAPRPANTPLRIVSHAEWEVQPPLGYAADATRRNIGAGDSLTFRDLRIHVIATSVDSTGNVVSDVAQLRLQHADTTELRSVHEGAAFSWRGYRIAVVAVYGQHELGAGLVALEAATIASLPAHIAKSAHAGGAEMRLRVPHRITHVTLHHTGDARPLLPGEDPVRRLRGLQAWGASDRYWWDLPYHFLLDLDGTIYEGRDYRYMGETNTSYDPEGHFLISVIGNEQQEPTAAQIDAIANLMAWALVEFDLPVERIGGHYDYADTTCPGTHLRRLLEDGTLQRMIDARMNQVEVPAR